MLNRKLSWSLLELLKPPAAEVELRLGIRNVLDELDLIELGQAKRGEISTEAPFAFERDLARFAEGALVVPPWNFATIGTTLDQLGRRATATAKTIGTYGPVR